MGSRVGPNLQKIGWIELGLTMSLLVVCIWFQTFIDYHIFGEISKVLYGILFIRLELFAFE